MHPPPQCEALLNPANEQLVGTRFTPAECVRNLRGARDDAIIYPPQVVDGLVHELGGAALAEALAALPADARGHRCEAGAAVATDAFGELRAAGFSHIIHAVAPHFEAACTDAHSTTLLERVRRRAARRRAPERRECGGAALAGRRRRARGTPLDEAARAAARALANWRAAELPRAILKKPSIPTASRRAASPSACSTILRRRRSRRRSGRSRRCSPDNSQQIFTARGCGEWVEGGGGSGGSGGRTEGSPGDANACERAA